MTRITNRHLIQIVEPDQILFMDESSGTEILKPASEIDIILAEFRESIAQGEAMHLEDADDNEWYVIDPLLFAPIEATLAYFREQLGIPQASVVPADIPIEEAGL